MESRVFTTHLIVFSTIIYLFIVTESDCFSYAYFYLLLTFSKYKSVAYNFNLYFKQTHAVYVSHVVDLILSMLLDFQSYSLSVSLTRQADHQQQTLAPVREKLLCKLMPVNPGGEFRKA